LHDFPDLGRGAETLFDDLPDRLQLIGYIAPPGTAPGKEVVMTGEAAYLFYEGDARFFVDSGVKRVFTHHDISSRNNLPQYLTYLHKGWWIRVVILLFLRWYDYHIEIAMAYLFNIMLMGAVGIEQYCLIPGTE
jgi:hypothetical protein